MANEEDDIDEMVLWDWDENQGTSITILGYGIWNIT